MNVPCYREVVSFLGWLHAHNATIPADEVWPLAADVLLDACG